MSTTEELTLAKATATIRQRVRDGAKFLDEKIPNWFMRAEPRDLCMSSYRDWIIAQVTGSDYGIGVERLGLNYSTGSRVKLGFCCGGIDHNRPFRAIGIKSYDYYLILQDYWLYEIARRTQPQSRKYHPEQVTQTEET